jgi:hypothetical protein
MNPGFGSGPGRRGRRGPGPEGFPPVARSLPPIDQLAPLLKPADPRLFEVTNPDQFRKALAAILTEIAKL